MNFSILLVYCLFATAGWALASPKGACQSSLHIENKPVILNLAAYAGCSVKITTEQKRVIAFHHVEGLISDLTAHLKIHDGLGLQASYVHLEKTGNYLKKANVNYAKTVYSTDFTAVLEIASGVPSELHLKISKAVDCPFSLGPESQCGRILDEESCYCATFTKRNWADQRNYCNEKGYKFLAIETPAEESAIYAAWGRETTFWTSLNDIASDGIWIWDSTSQNLYPGYVNWSPGEPNNEYDGAEDCACLSWYANSGWNDARCSDEYDAICENHP